MSNNSSRIIAQRLCEAYNSREIDQLDRLVSADCVNSLAEPKQTIALESLKQAWAQLFFTFPQSHLKPENWHVEENQVNLNALFQRLTPQGKEELAILLAAFRIKGDQIVEMINLIRWN